MDNVWSRAFRRRQQKNAGENDAAGSEEEIDDEEAALGFKIQLRYDKDAKDTVVVIVRWLKGNDSVLFESFCGMIKRTLEGVDD